MEVQGSRWSRPGPKPIACQMPTAETPNDTVLSHTVASGDTLLIPRRFTPKNLDRPRKSEGLVHLPGCCKMSWHRRFVLGLQRGPAAHKLWCSASSQRHPLITLRRVNGGESHPALMTLKASTPVSPLAKPRWTCHVPVVPASVPRTWPRCTTTHPPIHPSFNLASRPSISLIEPCNHPATHPPSQPLSHPPSRPASHQRLDYKLFHMPF